MKPLAIVRFLFICALLCVCSVVRASDWENYPGSFDVGGWSVVRSRGNPSEVVLLGPPNKTVIVGSASEPLSAFIFSPTFIYAKTGAGPSEKYYVIERGWGPGSHLGDQIIVKLNGPMTRAELEGNSAWNEWYGGREWSSPQPPPRSIFWQSPGTFILYTIIFLAPTILVFLIPIIAIVLLILWVRRRSRQRNSKLLL
jgi:hypothetical protein